MHNFMLYPEFSQYKPYSEHETRLVNSYLDDEGNFFYVEPGFYSQLLGYKEKAPDTLPKILKKMDEIIKTNHHVIFTMDYESPFVRKDDFIYVEIGDITDALKCTWIDDSRPSDYGD